MEVDENYPEEITSVRVNQVCGHDIFSLGKKRKFLAETEQLSLQVSKYICRERLLEHNRFSKKPLQAKVFYTHIKQEKAPLEEVDEDTGEESAQDSNNAAGESFSEFKSDGRAKGNSYDESSSSSSSHSDGEASMNAFHSMNSTVMTCAGPGNDEFQGDDIPEDSHDEFGQGLGYLASACGNGSKPQTDEELQEFLYSNGMIPKSNVLSSKRLTNEDVCQKLDRKPTIDQEFEQYFSMLML